jgi:pyruvate/2-oxoglutarate dehydrogenase complex dihydrolipoamide acyltransferase (E2) component
MSPVTQKAGTLTEMHVTEGQYVVKNSDVFTIDNTVLYSAPEAGVVVDFQVLVGDKSPQNTVVMYVLKDARTSRIRKGDTSGVTDTNPKPNNGNGNSSNLLRTPVTGKYSSITVTAQGYPRIVYFDQTNQRPRLAWAENDNPTGPDFKSIYVLADGDPNYKFTGKFSAVKIDSSGNLHIAMIHSMGTSQLVYAKLTYAGGVYTPGTSTIVDNTGSVGSWAEMTLDNQGNPWISYVDMARKDFYDGVKLAYLSPTQFPRASADENGRNNTGWEYINIPARFVAKEDRTGVAVYQYTGPVAARQQFWHAAVGYLSDDYYRVAYYVKPTTASGPTP